MDQGEVERGLRALGLAEGDHVLLHSSLSSLGLVQGNTDAVVDAFLAVLGAGGTLVVPTFGNLGVIAEVVRQRADAVSSLHPKASVAAIGGRAEEIVRDHWEAELAHGEGTPYMRLAEWGGYVCLLGVDQDRNTTLHAVESMLRLAYLKTTDEFTFDTPGGEVTRSWPHFPGPHRDFIGLDRVLRDKGIMRVGRIGPAVVRLMPSRETVDALLELGVRDPAFALCDNPNCAACVQQRADLRRDRLAGEDFCLATAGSLAGRYVPEMIENCKAAGIDAVELDCVQGRPVQVMEVEDVAAVVQTFRTAGCEVVALRGAYSGEEVLDFLKVALACRVERVVLPLTGGAAEHAVAARDLGLHLSLYNAHLSSARVFAIMRDLRARELHAGLAFGAAQFARAGEKPFLESHGNKLKRFVDQLDIEDCTFDGMPTPLAGGNAEIKELVSILRCSGFAGYMVLGAGNRAVGGLVETAKRFVELLDHM